MIMGGLKHINIVRAFVCKICFKLKEVSLEITNLFMEDIIYRSYGRVDGDDDDVNIRDEDEGDGSNERGVCDEDQDGVPSYHGSTSSLYNYDQSVKRKGFDTPIDPITRKKKLCLYGTTE